MRLLTPLLLLGFLQLIAQAAQAVELVVMDSTSDVFKPGQTLSSDKPLKLGPGQNLNLIAENGTVLHLKGPYDQTPVPAAASGQGGTLSAVKDMFAPRSSDKSNLGVTRDANMDALIAAKKAGTLKAYLPEPWLISVDQPGQRCFLEGKELVFWRSDDSKTLDTKIARQDGHWSAAAPWESGFKKLAAPPDLTLKDGDILVFSMGKNQVALTFHPIPASVTHERILSAWLEQKGCSSQTAALVNMMHLQ
ncbi:exported hypothetical protein [Rhodospirillaceae bacterium LM-1]|nr:exported hypothetical protein [Rhodospirillaceae bacterium LM-1]